MTDYSILSDIHNGAQCKAYCWSQSHGDLEIRIKLDRLVRYEDVSVILTQQRIKVTLLELVHKRDTGDSVSCAEMITTKVLLDGTFERRVNTESFYWLIDGEEPSITIYVDKKEGMWWRQLLMNEEVAKHGPRNYTLSMDHLDDGSRMTVDKLIFEQRTKKTSSEDRYSSV